MGRKRILSDYTWFCYESLCTLVFCYSMLLLHSSRSMRPIESETKEITFILFLTRGIEHGCRDCIHRKKVIKLSEIDEGCPA